QVIGNDAQSANARRALHDESPGAEVSKGSAAVVGALFAVIGGVRGKCAGRGRRAAPRLIVRIGCRVGTCIREVGRIDGRLVGRDVDVAQARELLRGRSDVLVADKEVQVF